MAKNPNKSKPIGLFAATDTTNDGILESIASETTGKESKPRSKKGKTAAVPNDHPKEIFNWYYVKLRAKNLFTYLDYALIYPLRYEKSESYLKDIRESDNFTTYPDIILLLADAPAFLKEGEILLKVSTYALNIGATKTDRVFFTYHPIPISRLLGIEFSSAKSKILFLADIMTYPDSAINAGMCIVREATLTDADPNSSQIEFTDDACNTEFLREKLERFDKLLGMFAFMKNIGVFYAGRVGLLDEYPQDIFNALKILNPGMQNNQGVEDKAFKRILMSETLKDEKAFGLIHYRILTHVLSNGEFGYEAADSILEEAKNSTSSGKDKDDIEATITSIEGLKTVASDYLELMQSALFKDRTSLLSMVLLLRFPSKEKAHSDKQSVRNFFTSSFEWLPIKQASCLSAILGLYYGYRNMVKEDNLDTIFQDKALANYATKFNSIKFGLINNLERIIIETCYQSAFADKNPAPPIERLLEVVPQISMNLDGLPITTTEYRYEASMKNVLGSPIASIQRVDLRNEQSDRIPNIYKSNIKESMLYTYLLANLRPTQEHLLYLMRESPIELSKLTDLINLDSKTGK